VVNKLQAKLLEDFELQEDVSASTVYSEGYHITDVTTLLIATNQLFFVFKEI
jgi:hypothetical protein